MSRKASKPLDLPLPVVNERTLRPAKMFVFRVSGLHYSEQAAREAIAMLRQAGLVDLGLDLLTVVGEDIVESRSVEL